MSHESLPGPLRACAFSLLLSPGTLGLCVSGLTVSLPRFGLLFLDKICGAWAAERCKSFSIIHFFFFFLQGNSFWIKNAQRVAAVGKLRDWVQVVRERGGFGTWFWDLGAV